MNPNDPIAAGLTRRQTLLAFLGAAGLSACGGGGDVAGVGAGGTGSFSVGPITGFGSIIVNGIRYDDSSATITNDGQTFSRSGLRLGMVVAVQGSTVVNGVSTGTRIALGSELVGPAVNLTGSGFEVLGQTVLVNASTFFVPSLRNLADLQANDVVEVHGVAVAGTPNTLQATYIERKSRATEEYRIQGIVTAHDAGLKTFSIGTLNMSYASTDTDDVRVTPNLGALVRVRLLAGTGPVWTVERIRRPEDGLDDFSDDVEFKGTITAFTSTRNFSVNQIPVDASGARFPEGEAGIELGAYVEVEGLLVNGVFMASEVELEDEDENEDEDDEFELHGTISGATTSGSGGSFTLTSSGGVSMSVDWSNTTVFEDGTFANLTSNQRAEVKGTIASGNRITATKIEFES